MFGPIKSGKQGNGNGLLRRLKNNINTQSSSKMPAIDREQSEHAKSKETLRTIDDPYHSVKHVSSKVAMLVMNEGTDKKKRPALPLQ
jgi:hypothetical protein